MNREDKLANWQAKTSLKVEDVAYHQAKANGTRLGVIAALRKKDKKKSGKK